MIGLDIGTYSIKAVELEKKDDSLVLVSFKVQERPQETEVPLSTILKKFFEEGKFNSRDTSISVSGPLAAVRLIELPEMSDEELKNAVRFEAEKYIPFNIEEAILDYQIVSRNPETKKITILFSTVKNDLVKNYINAVIRFGFAVKAVDVDAIALTNAFLKARPVRNEISNGVNAEKKEGADEAIALLNAGDSFLNMSIVYQEVPFVVRDMGGCGRELTEEIAKGLGLNKKEALGVKHNPPSDKEEALSDMIRPVLDKLAKEIRLSLGYFENQFARGIRKIYLSGGSSRLFGLKEFLSESLEVPVESWDPFGAVKIGESISVNSLEGVKTELAVALGLALRDDSR